MLLKLDPDVVETIVTDDPVRPYKCGLENKILEEKYTGFITKKNYVQ